ncbi:hypothetical protein ACQKAS_05120 [Helicobacter pylori]
MIKEIKVGEGLVLAIFPYNRDFTGFDHLRHSIPTRLRKILLLGCRGKISLFVRVKYSIIKF